MKGVLLTLTAFICCLLTACSGHKDQEERLAIESFGRPEMGQKPQERTAVIEAPQADSVKQVVETVEVVEPTPAAAKEVVTQKVKPAIKKPVPVRKIEPEKVVQSSPVDMPQGSQEQPGRPRTREEARDRAYGLYIAARRALSGGAVDSALTLITKSIEMYENGATYALKARALTQIGDYGAARVAAERSEGKSDHWQPENTMTARQEKITAMQKMYEQKPSSILRREIENATQY